MNWEGVDWFHLFTNGAGVIGDVAGALAFWGVIPAAPIAVPAQIIDVGGVAVDVYDFTKDNDVSGVGWDAVSTIVEETSAGRLVPILGFMLNVKGVYDAWTAGLVQRPILKPYPTIGPPTPVGPFPPGGPHP